MNAAPPPPLPPAPVRHVIEVTAARGGISRAFGLVIGLILLAIVFATGVIFGVGGTLVSGQLEPQVVDATWRSGTRDTIAILPVEGIILDGASEFVRVAVNRILDDDSVKAVILRVDSPGGAVSPSDRIWRDVQRLRDSGRPVVASFGGLAASGGYYVACHSDHIVAEPTNITGSIGVIAQVLTFGDLMERIGVDPVTMVATGSPEKAVGNDIFRTWTDADRDSIQRILDAAHTTFRARVVDGRGAALGGSEAVDAVADGRVFTAAEALDLRLVDQIGYIDEAIAVAEQRAGLAAGRATVIRLGPPPTLIGALLGAQRASVIDTPLDAANLRALLHELALPRAMYLMH